MLYLDDRLGGGGRGATALAEHGEALEAHVHLQDPAAHEGNAVASGDVAVLVIGDVLGLGLQVLVGDLEGLGSGGEGLPAGADLEGGGLQLSPEIADDGLLLADPILGGVEVALSPHTLLGEELGAPIEGDLAEFVDLLTLEGALQSEGEGVDERVIGTVEAHLIENAIDAVLSGGLLGGGVATATTLDGGALGLLDLIQNIFFE